MIKIYSCQLTQGQSAPPSFHGEVHDRAQEHFITNYNCVF